MYRDVQKFEHGKTVFESNINESKGKETHNHKNIKKFHHEKVQDLSGKICSILARNKHKGIQIENVLKVFDQINSQLKDNYEDEN